MYPTDRKYSDKHEWVSADGEIATLGITDYAQDQLGDIVFVELPELDTEVEQGDVLGTIESVKSVAELYAPVGGTVVEINETLVDGPEAVNKDPHGGGWFCKVRLADPGQLDGLMDAAGYASHIGD